jgi:hypothetical protein
MLTAELHYLKNLIAQRVIFVLFSLYFQLICLTSKNRYFDVTMI